jgi:hypothetical protein
LGIANTILKPRAATEGRPYSTFLLGAFLGQGVDEVSASDKDRC